jgi:hypothetical protein
MTIYFEDKTATALRVYCARKREEHSTLVDFAVAWWLAALKAGVEPDEVLKRAMEKAKKGKAGQG